MGISLEQWRSRIGTFISNRIKKCVRDCDRQPNVTSKTDPGAFPEPENRVELCHVTLSLLCVLLLLFICGDVELNPGPPSPKAAFSKWSHPCELKNALEVEESQLARKHGQVDREVIRKRLLNNCLQNGLEFSSESPADGNCLFRAVCDQLSKNRLADIPHTELRKELAAFLLNNSKLKGEHSDMDMTEAVGGPGIWEDYCSKLAQDGEWADHIAVVGLAHMLQMDILLVTSSPVTEHTRAVHMVAGRAGCSGTPLMLGHLWKHQYESLKLIDNKDAASDVNTGPETFDNAFGPCTTEKLNTDCVISIDDVISMEELGDEEVQGENSGPSDHVTSPGTEPHIHLQFEKSVLEGSLHKVRGLVKNVLVNRRFEPQGHTALQIAASGGNKDIVRVLMENKAKVDLCNKLGQSPFWKACKNGHSETAKLLLKYGADVNKHDVHGRSPLWAVANANHLNKATIMLLLEQENIDVNRQDSNGVCPLWAAVKQGNKDACKCLLLYGAKAELRNDNGQSSVWVAAFYGHLDIMKLIVRPYNSSIDLDAVDNKGRTPIFAAASEGHANVVEFLLEHGANGKLRDENGNGPLFAAATQKHMETFLILLELEDTIYNSVVFEFCKMLDLDALCILHTAVRRNDIDLLEGALHAGAGQDVQDRQGYTALQRAIQTSNVTAMDILLATGCNTNIANKEGWTPLFTAIFGNSTVANIDKLLKHGADTNHKDLNGVKPLQLALEKGQADVILLLLENSASTDLTIAAEMGTLHVIKKLIASLSENDINKQDVKGETALHKACSKNNLDVAKYLLENGAIINIVNVFERAPLHTAIMACSWDAAAYLISRDDVRICLDYKDYNEWNVLHLAVREAQVHISRLLTRKCPYLLEKKDCFNHDVDTFISRGKIRYHKDETDGGDILPSIGPQNPLQELVNLSPTYDEVRHKKLMMYEAYDYIVDIRKAYEERSEEKSIYNPDVMGTMQKLLFTDGLGSCANRSRWPWKFKTTITETVKQFMQILVQEMNTLDPLLELEMHFHGSSKEGTKVGLMDEFDCRLHVTGLEKEKFVIVDEELKHSIILKINKCNELAVQNWGRFCDNHQYLVPNRLFKHIYKTMCNALVRMKKSKTLKNIKLYLKDVNNEQVHFEWVCPPYEGMPLKIDVVFVVTLKGWWPDKGIKESKIISKDAFHKTNVLLRANGWRPSSALQELMVMNSIPPIPKFAYILCKVINNLVVYTKHDSRNKVKTYHLKNALWIMYESLQYNEDACCKSLPTGPKCLKLWELNESHLRQIRQWALAICDSGIQHVMAGKAFYFQLSQSSLHPTQLTMFTDMVHFLLDGIEGNSVDMFGMSSISRVGSRVRLVVEEENKQCPTCGYDDLDDEDQGNFYNYRKCSECQTMFCWLCLKEVSFLHFITLSGCTFGGVERWSQKKRTVIRILFLFSSPFVILLAAACCPFVIIIGLPKLMATDSANLSFGNCKDFSVVTLLHVVKLGYESCASWKSTSSFTTVAATFTASAILAVIVMALGVPALTIHLFIVIPVSWTVSCYFDNRYKSRHAEFVQSRRKMKSCPACAFPNEKTLYNNVTCVECDADFCWLCGKEVYFLHFVWPSGCTYWGNTMWSRKKMFWCWLFIVITSPFTVTILAALVLAIVTIGFPMAMTHLHKHFAKFSSLPTGIWALLVSPLAGLVTSVTSVPLVLLFMFFIYPVYMMLKSYEGHKVVGKRTGTNLQRTKWTQENKYKKSCRRCEFMNVKTGNNYIKCADCSHSLCWLCLEPDVGLFHFLPHTGCPIWGKKTMTFWSKFICWVVMVFVIPSLLAGAISACVSMLICWLINIKKKFETWHVCVRVFMCLIMMCGPFAPLVMFLSFMVTPSFSTDDCYDNSCDNNTLYLILIWVSSVIGYWLIALGLIKCCLERPILCLYALIVSLICCIFVTVFVVCAVIVYTGVVFPVFLCVSGIVVCCAQIEE